MPVDKSAIGRTGEPVIMHVERGKIQEFARAIKDERSITPAAEWLVDNFHIVDEQIREMFRTDARKR